MAAWSLASSEVTSCSSTWAQHQCAQVRTLLRCAAHGLEPHVADSPAQVHRLQLQALFAAGATSCELQKASTSAHIAVARMVLSCLQLPAMQGCPCSTVQHTSDSITVILLTAHHTPLAACTVQTRNNHQPACCPAGEVVVFNINGRDIPIVHRVIKVHERANENHLDILTKVGPSVLASLVVRLG